MSVQRRRTTQSLLSYMNRPFTPSVPTCQGLSPCHRPSPHGEPLKPLHSKKVRAITKTLNFGEVFTGPFRCLAVIAGTWEELDPVRAIAETSVFIRNDKKKTRKCAKAVHLAPFSGTASRAAP